MRDWRQMICKFCMLLREAEAHKHHQTGNLIDCSLLSSNLKKRGKDYSFKHFARNRQDGHWSVIFLFVYHLFMKWHNICLFPFIWKTFISYTVIKDT